ncbi:MAG TPA: type II toxin-antitoxin system VapC family toxin [Kofleriaceae bacterium]|nr:type II toxin-antitoxin system VapC family toxin [Kofleriaceae bacterium]
MARPVAVLDTDVISIALDNTNAPSVEQRRTFIALTTERLEKMGAIYAVPSPVVAELHSGGPADALIEIAKVLRGITVHPLDEESARIAGQIATIRLKNRAPKERGAVKYDTLIFAIAHQIGARWLLTGNRRDYEPCKKAIASPVEIVVATEAPPGQQSMLVVTQSKP